MAGSDRLPEWILHTKLYLPPEAKREHWAGLLAKWERGERPGQCYLFCHGWLGSPELWSCAHLSLLSGYGSVYVAGWAWGREAAWALVEAAAADCVAQRGDGRLKEFFHDQLRNIRPLDGDC